MKKFFFSFAAFLMVACTALTFVSCGDGDSTDDYVEYTYYFDGSQPDEFNEQAEAIYLKYIRNAVSLSSSDASYFTIKTTGASQDAAIKAACQKAETEVEALSKNFSGTTTFKVDRILTNSAQTNVNVYAKGWTGTK